MELRRYADDDLALSEALESDAGAMSELGGPSNRADILAAHARRIEDEWWLTIVPEPGGRPAGTIGIWDSVRDGATLHEVGWMVLPALQGRGVASAALDLLLGRAREEPRFDRIHAFPGVTNAASNALCRKFGFLLTGESVGSFRGRELRCNHWELDLRAAAGGSEQGPGGD